MRAHRGDELLTVPSELRLAHARQGGELVEIGRHVFCYLTKSGIMKNDIRRQAVLVRKPFALRPQALEQRIVRGRCACTVLRPTRRFHRAGNAHGAFAAQYWPALRVERQHRIAVLRFLDQSLMQESPREVAPFVDPPMFADPVDTQCVMTAREHAFGPGAAKNVDDIGRAEALMALSQSCNTGQELPRLCAPVLDGPRFAAVITCSARAGKRLAEVTQLHRTTAFGRVRKLQ